MGPAAEREEAALASLIARSASVPPGRTEPYGPHPDQRLEWFCQGGSATAPVVLVHGGYFRPAIDRSHARLTAASLAEALAAPVVLIEYRRISGTPEATVADISAVSDALEGMDEVPAAWVGHSAGGTLALQRAFDPVRPGVPTVALAPIADLRAAVAQGLGEGAVLAWLGSRRAAKPSRYAGLDPARLARATPERSAQVLCLHGSHDGVVPASQSRGAGVPLRLVEGAHHYDLIDPESAAWPVVVEAVRASSVQP